MPFFQTGVIRTHQIPFIAVSKVWHNSILSITNIQD